jgi:hypothetical protein
MWYFDLFCAIVRLIGLGEKLDGWLKQREDKRKAQDVANTPTTDSEWTKAAKDGDL